MDSNVENTEKRKLKDPTRQRSCDVTIDNNTVEVLPSLRYLGDVLREFRGCVDAITSHMNAA